MSITCQRLKLVPGPRFPIRRVSGLGYFLVRNVVAGPLQASAGEPGNASRTKGHMFYLHQRLDPRFEELLSALTGEPLTHEEAVRLISARGSELPALMLAASAVRDQGKGATVTYSRKVFIPLTNLCRQKCGYCTFARGPKDPIAHTMSPDEVIAVAEAGRRRGCKGSAVLAGREAGGDLRLRARRPPPLRSRDDDLVPARDVRARAQRDRPAAARQPGHHDARRDRLAARVQRHDGPDAGNDIGAPARERRGALQLSRQDPGAAPPNDARLRRAGRRVSRPAS